MGSIGFRIRTKMRNKEVPVYVYMHNPNSKRYECKTGLFVYAADWQLEAQRARPDTHANFELNEHLDQLRIYLLRAVNRDQSLGIAFSKHWLSNQIALFFNRSPRHQEQTLLYQAEYYIERAGRKRSPVSGSAGLSHSAIKNHLWFYSVIESYQKIRNTVFYLDEINESWVHDFLFYLHHDKDHSINVVATATRMLKSILNDARRQGLKVHPYSKHLKVYKMRTEDRRPITLTLEEIEKLKQLGPALSEPLYTHWVWMLIGLHIGQRAGDLLALNSTQIRLLGHKALVDVLQQKTKRVVTIGVVDPIVVELLSRPLPKKVRLFQFNKKIKELCKLAGIDHLVEGYRVQPGLLRKKLGLHPKCELIASHDLRRTFATNHYGRVPTPVLMQITGHVREHTFLQYVNRTQNKDVFALNFIEALEKSKQDHSSRS
jgi:integrase